MVDGGPKRGHAQIGCRRHEASLLWGQSSRIYPLWILLSTRAGAVCRCPFVERTAHGPADSSRDPGRRLRDPHRRDRGHPGGAGHPGRRRVIWRGKHRRVRFRGAAESRDPPAPLLRGVGRPPRPSQGAPRASPVCPLPQLLFRQLEPIRLGTGDRRLLPWIPSVAQAAEREALPGVAGTGPGVHREHGAGPGRRASRQGRVPPTASMPC